MTSDGPLTLVELARTLGRYRRVELGLFGLLGAAVEGAAHPPLALALSGASRAHAYRAALVEAELPLGNTPAADAAGEPDAASAARLGELSRFGAPELAALMVRVWYPEMLSVYRRHLAGARSPADGPARRLLGRLAFDLERSAAELAAALPQAGTGLDEVAAAADTWRAHGPSGGSAPPAGEAAPGL